MTNVVLAWSDFILDFSDALGNVPHPIYIVGGAVRDAILRRPIKDLDLVTAENGMALARRIANLFSGDYYPLDDSRDVGRAILETQEGRLVIDVSGLRAPDLHGDLADRDFTLNAIAVDLHGDLQTLIDPLGGVADLLGKTLRQCASASLTNDPIRALRGVRQSVQFGLRIDSTTMRAMKAAAPLLAQMSAERVRDELIKLLSLSRPVTGLRVAQAVGLLGVVLPETERLPGLPQGMPHLYDAWNHALAVVDALNDICSTISNSRTDETAAQFNLGMVAIGLDRFRANLQQRIAGNLTDDRSRRAIILLAALLHEVGKTLVEPHSSDDGEIAYSGYAEISAQVAFDRLTSLRFSNSERKLVASLIRHQADDALRQERLSPLQVYRFWRSTGEDGIDLILLILADYLGTVGHTYDQQVWLRMVENAQLLLEGLLEKRRSLVDPPAVISGDGLMAALGLSPGPVVRDLLEVIREGQVDGQVHTFDDAVRRARAALNNGHAE
ncbi:MAG: HD domain-containing protein [Anaerolineae bacterium]|nr:HD domain-containing protein [Anaerolineae bacterium]